MSTTQNQEIQERIAAVNERLVAQGIQEEYSAAIIVKMLSGKIIPIGIHMEQSMTMLRYGFVAQLGYNPSVAERLSFLDEDGPLQEKSWKEKYGEVENIPMIHVFIQEKEDPRREAKLGLLRTTLRDKNYKTELADAEIWSLYSSWNLTYLAPPKSNRYTKLVDFVLNHPHVFLEMTDEEVEERKRTEEATRERKIEELMVQRWIQYRDKDVRIIQRRMEDPQFLEKREIVRERFLSMRERHNHFRCFDPTALVHLNRQILRHYFTVQELLDMDVPPNTLSVDWEITQWFEYSAKAQVYEAQQAH